ncbi:MAG: hypothetical protein M1837_006031 [Sclerophora amabilis]|nr:MAG: hypothetical protein M1837_006031 [Sclerophora amabilis]
MPLRPLPLSFPKPHHVEPQCYPYRASFHTFPALRADSTADHYGTLELSSTASAGDIKKQFYSLSKAHHPDHNPNDPKASERFVKISEAYAVLGNPKKRERYDRDHSQHASSSSSGRTRPGQSTSSSGPAGGRPASGLSRRRTQFRGPPPSFYRSGGWGNHREKRQAQADSYAEGSGAAAGGGFGPGEAQRGRDDDVPHFDRDGHYRTQTEQDRRRQRRMSEDFFPGDRPGSILTNFLFVGGIITLAIVMNSGTQAAFGKPSRDDK